MKKIEDYLHLYLGCKLESAKGNGFVILVAVQIQKIPCTDFKIVVLNGNEVYSTDLGSYKPILRPLSDMTEEENKESSTIWFNEAEKQGKIDIHVYAAVTNYMLSKHFDIFNLIPEGLAINPTS